MDLQTQRTILREPHVFLAPQNPIHALYGAKRVEVLATRRARSARLRSASPRAADIVEEFCRYKLHDESSPHLGEMLPWIVADLGGVNDPRVGRVAVGWLAVYVYGLLIDERADAGSHLSSGEQLASLLLLQIGLQELHTFLIGSQFEHVFSRHLALAVEGQLSDVSDQHLIKSEQRQAYTISKNSCLVCGASAVAALTPTWGPELVSMIEELRLAFQYLDDLGDWRLDAASNNHTLLLADAIEFSTNGTGSVVALSDYKPGELMALMIESGALGRVLSAIDESLDNQKRRLAGQGIDSPAERFFRELAREVKRASGATSDARTRLSDASLEERYQIGDRIEHQLMIIAQGT